MNLNKNLTAIGYSVVAVTLLLCTACSSYSKENKIARQSDKGPFCITNVNLLAEQGEKMLPNRTVCIANRVISSIYSKTIPDKGYRQIDGSNQYLIPGLIESHAHLQKSRNDLKVFLAHGITGIREMAGNSQHLQWRESIEQGDTGPEIFLASEKISSKSGFAGWFDSLVRTRLNVADEAQARQLVADLAIQGYQGVKIAGDINQQMYRAIIAAAQVHKLKIVGHIPDAINLTELWSSGQNEVAHVEEFVKALSREFGGYNADSSDDFLQFVHKRSDYIAKNLKKRDIAVVSSLWLTQSFYRQAIELEQLWQETDTSFTHPDAVKRWQPGNNQFEISAQISKANRERTGKYWKTYAQAAEILLKAMTQQEVRILAGTDTNASMVVPGISLHQELQALVALGFSNSEALRAATQAPALWDQQNTGMIAEGFEADLLLLKSNPLVDISHTQTIAAVINNGTLYERPELTDLLEQVRQAYR